MQNAKRKTYVAIYSRDKIIKYFSAVAASREETSSRDEVERGEKGARMGRANVLNRSSVVSCFCACSRCYTPTLSSELSKYRTGSMR